MTHAPDHAAAFWHFDVLLRMASQQGVILGVDRLGRLTVQGGSRTIRFDIGLVRSEFLAWLQAAGRI